MNRPALFVIAAFGSAVAWTLLASAAYAWLGAVPFHCWFYYAVPWPDDFLWSGLYLIVSGFLAATPFSLAQWVYQKWYKPRQHLYGKTGWAKPSDMKRGGIKLDEEL